MALANIERAFPGFSVAARRRVGRASFQHLGLMFVELCSVLTEPPERTLDGISLDGLDHLRHAMKTHGRALVLTAHLGNWELLSLIERLLGFPAAVVVRPLDAPWLDGLADRWRQRTGIQLIDKRGALRPVLSAIRGGRLVALLLDQNATRHESVFVSFFGRPASTSKSLAVLALRTRTPVIPMFIYRTGLDQHRVVIHPSLSVDAGPDNDLAVTELTQRCTAAIETAIGVAPGQWLWMHNRWRTRSTSSRRPAP